jgi:hypothetical protein
LLFKVYVLFSSRVDSHSVAHGSAGCLAPSSQIGFFDFIIMPMFTALAKAFPTTLSLATQAGANYRRWKFLQREGQELPPMMELDWYEEGMMGARTGNTLQDVEDTTTEASGRATSAELSHTSLAERETKSFTSLKVEEQGNKSAGAVPGRRSWEKLRTRWLWRSSADKSHTPRLSGVVEEREGGDSEMGSLAIRRSNIS